MPTNPAHVLLTPKTCPCDKEADNPACHVCDGGLSICAICGKAEIELDGPCVPCPPAEPWTEEEIGRMDDELMCDFYGYPKWVLDGPFPNRQIDGHI